MTISSISATDDVDNANLTLENHLDDIAEENNTALSLSDDEELLGDYNIEIPDSPDTPDLIVNQTYYVHQSDIDEYFPNGILDSKYLNLIHQI